MKYLPGTLFLVHDGQIGENSTVHVEAGDAVALAEELASYEGCEWYVAQVTVIATAAHVGGRKKRRSSPHRSKGDGR